jgi:transcriptional regulator with XRE-family HTH domain
MSEISPGQCRAARALIGLSQGEVSKVSGVSEKTLADFEREARQPYQRTLAAIRSALESAGVEFIPENGGGAGVRLRKG